MKFFVIKSLLVVGLTLSVLGCSDTPVTFPDLPSAERQLAMEKWQRSCALCHVDGNGGAPIVGDEEAWSSRIKQSEQMLLSHTVEGLGRMPPLGYCMDCSKQEFLYLTGFMAGELND